MSVEIQLSENATETELLAFIKNWATQNSDAWQTFYPDIPGSITADNVLIFSLELLHVRPQSANFSHY